MVSSVDNNLSEVRVLHILAHTLATESVCRSLDTFLLCVIASLAQILHTRASGICPQILEDNAQDVLLLPHQ